MNRKKWQVIGAILFCLLSFNSIPVHAQLAAASTYGSFTVGGSSSDYYPVQFKNDIYGSVQGANTSDLVIFRDFTHENGSWYGTFNLVISFHPTDWGNFGGQIEKIIYQTGSGTIYNDPVGDIQDGSVSGGGNDLIVWLKGGGTYHWRNREATAGWSLENGNASGGSLVDSSGATLSPITSQSYLILQAKNTFDVTALSIATGNDLTAGGTLHVPGGGNGTDPSLHFTTYAPSGFNPGGNIGIWLDSSGSINMNASLVVHGNITLTGQGVHIQFPDGAQAEPYMGVSCGGDFAESVDVTGNRKQLSPGDVLVADPNRPGDFLKSSTPYSTAVLGVFSTKPGFVGRRLKGPKGPNEVPMAMVGIVPTKVTAENGPIHVGDLLVASSIPGYAMKGTDRSKMLGAVIGKALGNLKSGKGTIEVGITLQ